MGRFDYRILLIDDEPDIVEFLSYNLTNEGYQVYTAFNGNDGIKLAKEHKPDLIILDVMLPEMDGIEVCENLRSVESLRNVVIAFLTCRTEDYSQIAGFRAGGDDYITKPVKLKLFLTRVAALLRRQNGKKADKTEEIIVNSIKPGNLLINHDNHSITIDGEEMLMPKKEFKLLLLLSSKPGKVFSRESIFSSVWGDEVVVSERTIDVHIRKLRKKIGDNHIFTLKGVGYKYID